MKCSSCHRSRTITSTRYSLCLCGRYLSLGVLCLGYFEKGRPRPLDLLYWLEVGSVWESQYSRYLPILSPEDGNRSSFPKGCILFAILHVQWTKCRSQYVIWMELPCDKNGKHICSWLTNIGQKMTLALKVLMCIINKHLTCTNLNCVTCWHRNITITCNVGTYRVHTAVLWL
jgi:hypothetical protein